MDGKEQKLEFKPACPKSGKGYGVVNGGDPSGLTVLRRAITMARRAVVRVLRLLADKCDFVIFFV